MNEQVALYILGAVLPIIGTIIVWQQKQIQDNRRYIERLLTKCFEEDEKADPKKLPWE